MFWFIQIGSVKSQSYGKHKFQVPPPAREWRIVFACSSCHFSRCIGEKFTGWWWPRSCRFRIWRCLLRIIRLHLLVVGSEFRCLRWSLPPWQGCFSQKWRKETIPFWYFLKFDLLRCLLTHLTVRRNQTWQGCRRTSSLKQWFCQASLAFLCRLSLFWNQK